MSSRFLGLAACIACLLVAAGSARADIGPPLVCPEGQTREYYQGRYCAPKLCDDDSVCPGDSVCAVRGLCVSPRDTARRRRPMALGECDEASDCIAPAICVRRKFCGSPVPAASTAAPSDDEQDPPSPASATTTPSEFTSSGGCGGCGVASEGSTSVLAFVLALCLARVRMRLART